MAFVTDSVCLLRVGGRDLVYDDLVIGSIDGGNRRALSLGRWSSRLESCGLSYDSAVSVMLQMGCFA